MIDLIDFSRKVRKFYSGSGQKIYVIKRGGKLFLRKTFDKNNSRKIRNQVRWFIKNENKHVPTVEKYGDSFFVFYYDIPFYENYVPLSEFVVSNNINKSKMLIKDILKFMFKEFYIEEKSNDMKTKLDDYLKTRLLERFQNIAEINPLISGLQGYKEIIVNGKVYPSSTELIESMLEIKERIAELSNPAILNLHGDFTAENILCKEDDFMLIDPDENPYNSNLVDLGKLFQSFHSKYEMMIKTEKCEVKGNEIIFDEPKNLNYKKVLKFLCEELRNYIPREKFPLIIFNEAMHFSRMLPYKHKINPQLVPMYYGNTIRLLNSFIQLFKK